MSASCAPSTDERSIASTSRVRRVRAGLVLMREDPAP